LKNAKLKALCQYKKLTFNIYNFDEGLQSKSVFLGFTYRV